MGQVGVRDVINAVVDLLAFPFVAIENASGLPSVAGSVNSFNMGSPGVKISMQDKNLIKAIDEDMENYLEILFEVRCSFTLLSFFIFLGQTMGFESTFSFTVLYDAIVACLYGIICISSVTS